jgi:hypothetical protein
MMTSYTEKKYERRVFMLEVALNTIPQILIKITYVRGSQVVRLSILIQVRISVLIT